MNFDKELECRVKEIETIIKTFLPAEESNPKSDKTKTVEPVPGWARTVAAAMNYSVNAGGKRLRPMLMAETYKLFGGSGSVIEPFMAAIEMIHTYSLVHDDLPAMDNDEYRRGKQTTWVVYGEAMAILAGDGLLNYAFETALKSFEIACEDAGKCAKALSILAKKAGIYGMIGGQTADIEAENSGKDVTLEHLLYIHEHKTAALIQAAMMVGAVLAGASDEQVLLIEQAAYEIGIAFQIQDDILDVTSNLETLGKPVGSDAKNQKTTYVTIKGIEAATQEQRAMSAHAIEQLQSLEKEGFQNEFLTELVRSLITRIR